MRLQDTEYESYYGVQLLDDLHNYFPDIIYNHTRFTSIADVLGYIQEVMHDRFNLFSSATSRFRQNRSQQLQQQQTPRQRTSQYVYTIPTTFTDFIDTPSNNIQFAPIRFNTSYSSGRRPRTPPSPPSESSTDIEDNTTSDGSQPRVSIRPSGQTTQTAQRQSTQTQHPRAVSAVSVLSQILDPAVGVNDILSSLIGGSLSNIIPSNFTDPVIVSPSRHQIAAATRRYMAQSDLETPCAICQDTIRVSTEVRKIDFCQHAFHKECIDRWFRINVSCPVCRHDIRNMTATATTTATAGGAQVD